LVGIGAGLIAVAGGVGVGVRAAWRTNRRFTRLVDSILGDGTPTHPGVASQVEQIRAEVRLNGGRSLKDEVVAARSELGEMRLLLDGHLAWHVGNRGAIDPTVSLIRAPRSAHRQG
jgi:hypothetical protein